MRRINELIPVFSDIQDERNINIEEYLEEKTNNWLANICRFLITNNLE